MKTKNKVLTGMLGISLAVVSGALITLRNNAPVESKAADLTDTLVATNFAATGTTYTNFSYTSTGNEITYVGNSAKSTAGAIQLRSSGSTAGIISTTTKGTIKSVTVVWDSGTTDGRTLDIYGSNTAYTGSNAAALYSLSTQGTKLGNIIKGTSTTISPEENYSYIGLRSYSGAMYITSIAIVWAEPSVEPTVSLNSTSKLSYIGSGDISLSVANVANMVAPYAYSWSITSGTSVTIPASSTNSIVSATPSSSVTGDTVIRCTVTDSTEGTPLSAYAECTITIENVLSVAELLASTDESSYFVKGYVINDDYGSTNNSKFDMVDASAGVNTNNTTSIMLYSSSKVTTVAKGDYVIVYGPLTTYSGTRELNGFTVSSTSHTAELLKALVNGSDVDSQCSLKFAAAKAHFLAMSESEQTLFKTGDDYSTARTRYEAWATNQGQKPYAEGSALESTSMLGNSTSTILSISIISIISIIALSGYLFYSKKKLTK